MKWLGRVAKAGHKVHPIDQPVYDIMAQSSATVLCHAESGKRNGITKDENKVFNESL